MLLRLQALAANINADLLHTFCNRDLNNPGLLFGLDDAQLAAPLQAPQPPSCNPFMTNPILLEPKDGCLPCVKGIREASSTPRGRLNGMTDAHVRHRCRTALGEVEGITGAQNMQAHVIH